MDLPFETKILLFSKLYLQKIFCGKDRIQLPFWVLSFTFCSKLNVKLFVVFKFSIILSLIDADDWLIERKKNKIIKIFIIKELHVYQHD